jgi:hypothetical protein
MRVLRELASAIAAGLLALLGGIGLMLLLLVLWLCGIASALCLMVAGFAGIMYVITGKPHDGHIAITYCGYAAIPFVFTFIAGYYRSKFSNRSHRHAA